MCVSSLAHRKDKSLRPHAGAEAGSTAAVGRPSLENRELRAHDREVMPAVLQSACASCYAPSLGALTLSGPLAGECGRLLVGSAFSTPKGRIGHSAVSDGDPHATPDWQRK